MEQSVAVAGEVARQGQALVLEGEGLKLQVVDFRLAMKNNSQKES
jgi:hypothetical protein